MITMRPGYETLDYRSLPYRHYSDMRRPVTITEHLADGGLRETIVDGADLGDLEAGRVPQVSGRLRSALASRDPDVALRARKLQLLMLST